LLGAVDLHLAIHLTHDPRMMMSLDRQNPDVSRDAPYSRVIDFAVGSWRDWFQGIDVANVAIGRTITADDDQVGKMSEIPTDGVKPFAHVAHRESRDRFT